MLGRLSITKRMLILTILLGAAVWWMTDWFQGQYLREVFLSELKEQAAHQAREDRALFDEQVTRVATAARLITDHKSFEAYVLGPQWKEGTQCQLKQHFSPPSWMPESSVLRSFFNSRYALLISSTGRVCEVYFHYGEFDKNSLPGEFLVVNNLLQDLSHNQSYLTTVENQHYVLTAQHRVFRDETTLATLMLVSSIDDEFLARTKGIRKVNDTTMVLLNQGDDYVLASSDPDRIADGASVAALTPDYLMIGKSFFDYGASDLSVHLASFVPLESVEARVESIYLEGRIQRLYLAVILIATFSLLTFWIANRIKHLNGEVMSFTRKIAGGESIPTEHENELRELERRFRYLSNAVESAHARIKQEAEERIELSKQAAEGMQKASELELMRSVTDTLAVGIAIQGAARMVPFNSRMQQFVDQCKDVDLLIPQDEFLTERTVLDKESKRRTFAIMRHKVLGDDGFLVQEITTHKEAEVAMSLAKQAAEASNQAKSNFLANMSHELRTPMHAILSYSNIGFKKAGTASTEKLRGYFSSISQSGKRLMVLLDDLLDIAKLEANRMEFHIESHDLAEVINIATSEFAELAHEQQIELLVQNRCEDTVANFDHNRMLQVIRNLLSNAIKFTPSGKTISITLQETEFEIAGHSVTAALLISVADEGVGIPQSELETIFDKFVQSSKTKTGAGGTGLGLSICKEIVEAHRGRIWAENAPTGGALFSIVIPKQLPTGL